MVLLTDMKRALVVKALTDQILLVRTDRGDLLSLSVSCPGIHAGSMLSIDTAGSSETGCVILSVNGRACGKDCTEPVVAMIIEHKDSTSDELPVSGSRDDRNVI